MSAVEPNAAPKQFWLMAEEELLAEGQGLSQPPSAEPDDQPPDKA